MAESELQTVRIADKVSLAMTLTAIIYPGEETDVMIAEVNMTNSSPEARRNLPWAVGTPSAFMAQWAPSALRLAEAQAELRNEQGKSDKNEDICHAHRVNRQSIGCKRCIPE